MERIQEDDNHEYRLIPPRYNLSDNDRKATYDQFMSLRDTMVYSNKFYGNNAWRSLIVWMKTDWNPTNTIEIWEPNISRMDLQPDWTISADVKWKYLKQENTNHLAVITSWRYVIQHKEQFNNIDQNITRIHTYVLEHQSNWAVIERAVFDWEWNTPWEIIRLTAFGYVECDLQKWSWLELKIEDQNWDDITSEIAQNSNWRIVEYKDLPYKL
jgi:hypothetical protein